MIRPETDRIYWLVLLQENILTSDHALILEMDLRCGLTLDLIALTHLVAESQFLSQKIMSLYIWLRYLKKLKKVERPQHIKVSTNL